MRCADCEEANPAGASVCRKCGAPLASSTRSAAPHTGATRAPLAAAPGFTAAHTPPASLAESPFVGRAQELELLTAALSRAHAGRGRVVMLAGEPGIGKTRTAEALAEQAAREGVLVLWGRCPEEPGAPPFWPWLQTLRRYAELHDDAVLHAAMGAQAPMLVALDPALAERLPDVPEPPPVSDPAEARFRLFDAIAEFWRRAAAERPALLIFDDLHRADTSSLRLLEFVAGTLDESRVMFLGTYRDTEVGRRHPLSATLAELARDATFQRLRLTGFSPAESAEFVGRLAVADAPALATALHQRTEGHPLFLAEMARYLRQEGRLRAPVSVDAYEALRRLPEGVRDVIDSRLGRLAPRCQHVLGNAAVIGRGFALDVLIALLDDISADECLDAIEEAVASRLVEPLPEVGSYQFTHALVRDALYDEMPAARRLRLHRRVAETLEERHRDDLTPCLSALAWHYAAARPIGTDAKAVEYALRAASHADAHFAYEEAVRHYELALATIEAPTPERRCTLLLSLGEAQTKAGDSDAAKATFLAAAEAARRSADPLLAARAARSYEAVSWRTATAGSAAQAVALATEA